MSFYADIPPEKETAKGDKSDDEDKTPPLF